MTRSMMMNNCQSCGHECHCYAGECGRCGCDICDCGRMVNDENTIGESKG